MSRMRLPFLLAATLVAGLAGSAAAQGTACTTPNDPACNHLKCYQISDKASIQISKTPIVQVDNQFGREVLFRLQPVLLCVPSQKACCNATGCSVANCQPNPVLAPGLPHFKCYRIKAKTCPNGDCTTLAKFAKGTAVNLRDQFGLEQNVPVGKPVLLCAPADKQVVGVSSTTTTQTLPTSTTVTTSTTTTTIPPCHFDQASPTPCVGPCPPTAPAGSQCQLVAPNKCDCVAPPVCCECTGAAGTGCFDTNGTCPTGCGAVSGASCDPTTRKCECGFCRGSAGCIAPAIACDANNPCPQGTICDPVQCPRPCAGPCDQPAGQCTPDPCFRADGTVSQCHPAVLGNPCQCCGVPGTTCTTDFDCCSGVCNPPNCQ
jgi:hypothetical protein